MTARSPITAIMSMSPSENTLQKRLRRLLRKVRQVRALIRKAKQRPTTISPAGVEFVASFEGLPNVRNGRAYLYDDPATPPNATIGYGHLVAYKPVAALSTSERKRWEKGLTHTEALSLLESDLREYSDAIRDSVSVPLTQNQFDALVSFAFNNGVGAFLSSTLKRKIEAKAPPAEIRHEFSRWVNAGGRPLPGLVRRRAAEADLFFK